MKRLDDQAPFILRKLLAMINQRYHNLHHFSRICGISYVSLWKMFNQNTTIHWSTFRQILTALDTTEEEFCSGVEFVDPEQREMFELTKGMTPEKKRLALGALRGLSQVG